MEPMRQRPSYTDRPTLLDNFKNCRLAQWGHLSWLDKLSAAAAAPCHFLGDRQPKKSALISLTFSPCRPHRFQGEGGKSSGFVFVVDPRYKPVELLRKWPRY
jgi:hypothetical protein